MTDALDFLGEAADEDRSSLEYRLQTLVLELSERVHGRIEQIGVSQAEVARRMGVSRPMITKLLTGDSNFQLRTLLRLADALDMELMVDFVPDGFRLPRFYVNRQTSTVDAYTQNASTPSAQSARTSPSRKRQIVTAVVRHSTSEYSIPSRTKVA